MVRRPLHSSPPFIEAERLKRTRNVRSQSRCRRSCHPSNDVGRPKDLSDSPFKWSTSWSKSVSIPHRTSVRPFPSSLPFTSSNHTCHRALTDAALGKLASNLIVSFVYSHDVIARLSLGSVRDLRNAAAWLCEAERRKKEDVIREGYTAVTDRARRWKDGFGSTDDPKWVGRPLFIPLTPLF